MRKKTALILAFFLFLYIAPVIFMPAYSGSTILTESNMTKDFSLSEFWFNENWLYRKEIPIIEQAGASTDYQIPIVGYYDDPTKDIAGSIDFEGLCQNDFDDVLFTSGNGVTLLDFYIDAETYVLGTSTTFWIEVKENVSLSDVSIFCYWGNAGFSDSLSDPDATFIFFDDFENNNLDRWDSHGVDWSTTTAQKKFGSYSAYGDAGGSSADRQLFSNQVLNSGAYLVRTYARFAEIGNYYKWAIHLTNDVPTDVSGIAEYANDWVWYNGSAQYWEQNTLAATTWYEIEFAFDFSSSLAYAWINGVAKGSHSFVTFGDVIVTETALIGAMASNTANKDHWIDDYYIRKWATTEPTFDAPSTLEINDETYEWESIDSADLIFELPNWDIIGETIIIRFSVPIDETAMNWMLIFLGLCMIPTSTLYLVKGGKDELSFNKVFFFIIAFMLGWAIFLGGIYG